MSDKENTEDEGNYNEIPEDNNGNQINDDSIIEEKNEGEGYDNDEQNNEEQYEDDANYEYNDDYDDNDDEEKKKKKKYIDDSEMEKKKISDDVFYDINDLKPKQELNQVPDSFLEIVYIFGFESEKLNNLYFLNEASFISAIGNYVYIVNINTLKHKYIPGIKCGGIGAIAVNKKFIC